MVKTYYRLTKPGIIYGNVLNAVAGFFLALSGPFSWQLFCTTLLGLSLVVASACVVNNVLDHDIDQAMERTKHRAIPQGHISKPRALVFATLLLIGGVFTLWYFVNPYALGAALVGFVVYVGVYTPAKRRTPFAAELGSIAGAVPPVVGYVAVSGTLTPAAIVLFLIYTFWQMPHFFAIALRRSDEYLAAHVPVLPLRVGVYRTKWHILLYVLAFGVAALTLPYVTPMNLLYTAGMSAVCALWLVLAVYGFFVSDEKRWARRMFFYSLVVVLALCGVLILHRWMI